MEVMFKLFTDLYKTFQIYHPHLRNSYADTFAACIKINKQTVQWTK